MYKQIIIVRKDLDMSHGKMAAQVAHAAMAFLTTQIREKARKVWDREALQKYFDGVFGYEDAVSPDLVYKADLEFDQGTVDEWIDGAFTKCILEAKNKTRLLKAVEMAEELGMVEGKDYFLIRDNCYTELTPEEDGRCLTCIGFRPLPAEEADKIGKKYHLYVG